MDLDFGVWFHSALADPQCFAIVEVWLIQSSDGDGTASQFPAGWARIALVPQPAGSQCDLASSGVRQQRQEQRITSAAIHAGSPWCQQSRTNGEASVQGECTEAAGAHRPDAEATDALIAGYTVSYLFQMQPSATALMAALPQNCLVSGSDVIPGLRQHEAQQSKSSDPAGVSGTLTSPMAAPCVTLACHGLSIQLPAGFLDVLRMLIHHEPHLSSESYPAWDAQQGWASFQGSLAVRLTAHNGWTFVGKSAMTCRLTAQQQQQQRNAILQVEESLHLDSVPADVLIVCVLELLYIGPLAAEPSATVHEVVLGWAPVLPFAQVHAPGLPDIATSIQEVKLKSGPGQWVRPQPVLSWHSLLQQAGFSNPSLAASVVLKFALSGHSESDTSPQTPSAQRVAQTSAPQAKASCLPQASADALNTGSLISLADWQRNSQPPREAGTLYMWLTATVIPRP